MLLIQGLMRIMMWWHTLVRVMTCCFVAGRLSSVGVIAVFHLLALQVELPGVLVDRLGGVEVKLTMLTKPATINVIKVFKIIKPLT